MKNISFTITKTDKIIIVFVSIVICLIFAGFHLFVFNSIPTEVIIEVDNQVYARYNLADISGKKVINVTSKYGTNKIEITKDYAKILKASCPDKLDVLQGKITASNTAIVCLPNRVVVSMVGGKTDFDSFAN